MITFENLKQKDLINVKERKIPINLGWDINNYRYFTINEDIVLNDYFSLNQGDKICFICTKSHITNIKEDYKVFAKDCNNVINYNYYNCSDIDMYDFVEDKSKNDFYEMYPYFSAAWYLYIIEQIVLKKRRNQNDRHKEIIKLFGLDLPKQDFYIYCNGTSWKCVYENSQYIQIDNNSNRIWTPFDLANYIYTNGMKYSIEQFTEKLNIDIKKYYKLTFLDI